MFKKKLKNPTIQRNKNIPVTKKILKVAKIDYSKIKGLPALPGNATMLPFNSPPLLRE